MLRTVPTFDFFYHVLVTGSCDAPGQRRDGHVVVHRFLGSCQTLEEFPDHTPVIGDLDRPAVGGVQLFRRIDSHP